MNNVVVSQANRALVVPLNDMTVGYFSEAKRLDQGLVLPHDTRNFMLLRRMGYKVPNPILCYYDWRGGNPFSVQKSTCTMLTSNTRAYVLNDMGTGKTRAALWAWDYLHGNGCANKLLIVAPLSTLSFVWAAEAFTTLPHRKVAVLHGSKKKRQELLRDESHDIYVINHDGLKTIHDELSKRTDIDTLIIDELAVYRNNSDRSKLMRKFAQRFTWVWGMTGRPMPNDPTDVWAQAKIITPSTVPDYFRHAQSLLMVQVNNYKWLPKPDAVETAYRMLQPSVRYKLDDVVELPETIYRTIDVPLTAEQQKVYAKMVREFQVMVGNKVITAMNAAAAMNKLLQVSCGWVYTKAPEYVTLDNATRMDTLFDLIASAERKLIVFVPYRHAVNEISKKLTEASLVPGGKLEGLDHAVVHGGVSNRDQIFNLFQNSTKYKVLLAHPECLAHGLTLTAADTTIWFSPLASLDIYEQANARIIRVGQKHKQQIIHLQSTPVERKIYGLLRSKQHIQNQLLLMFEDATETAQ